MYVIIKKIYNRRKSRRKADGAQVLERLQNYSLGNTLLEVGVGCGELIAVALELGYDVDAVELNQNAAQNVSNLLGIPVWNCDFLQYNTEKKYSRFLKLNDSMWKEPNHISYFNYEGLEKLAAKQKAGKVPWQKVFLTTAVVKNSCILKSK